MFTNELKHGHVKKIVVDPTSGDVCVIHPIFPLAKVSKHYFRNKDWGMSGVVSKVVDNLKRAIGRADLTLMKRTNGKWDHPMEEGKDQYENYSYQAGFSIGKLMHVFENPDSDNVIWGASRVTDPIAKPVVLEYMDSYNRGLVPLFVSPQIVNSSTENPYAIEHFDLMHVALVSDPAFEESIMKVGAVCQGDVKQCTMQIHTASNTTENVNVMFIGKDVQVHTKTCPFCVETELRNLFKQNSSLKLNKASKLQMGNENDQKPPETEEKKTTAETINPDTDQKNNSSTIDVEALTAQITKDIEAKFNAQQVAKTEEQTKADEAKKDDEKKTETTTDTQKPFNIEDTPQYKALLKRLEKTEAALDKNKIDSEELKTLKNEQNFNKLGSLLAKYENNFVNPETNKPDPKAFDKAFEFLQKLGWNLEDIETHLAILSPYGSAQRKSIAPEQQSAIQRAASKNYGMPEFNSAFGDEKKEIHKASNACEADIAGLSLVDSLLKENEA